MGRNGYEFSIVFFHYHYQLESNVGDQREGIHDFNHITSSKNV